MEYSLNKCAYDYYENSVPDSLVGFMAGDILMKEAGLTNPGEEMASCKAFYMLLSDITSAIIASDREVSAIEVE